jgi:hypothetical protein
MKAGFKVETRHCGYFDKFLVVTNYQFSNLVVNYPMLRYHKGIKTDSDVGMWRIKTLKK